MSRDKVRSQEIRADQQHRDLGSHQGLFNFRFPILPHLNSRIFPYVQHPLTPQGGQHNLQPFEPVTIRMAIADKNLIPIHAARLAGLISYLSLATSS